MPSVAAVYTHRYFKGELTLYILLVNINKIWLLAAQVLDLHHGCDSNECVLFLEGPGCAWFTDQTSRERPRPQFRRLGPRISGAAQTSEIGGVSWLEMCFV